MAYKPKVLEVAAGGTGFAISSAFLAHLQTGTTNNTGDGTTYTIIYDTKDYDLNNNFNLGTSTFTAPVTGKYLFTMVASLSPSGTATTGAIAIVTTARTYTGGNCNPTNVKSAGGVTTMSISVIANMTAGDTATTVITASGTTKSLGVAGAVNTFFSGCLIA